MVARRDAEASRFFCCNGYFFLVASGSVQSANASPLQSPNLSTIDQRHPLPKEPTAPDDRGCQSPMADEKAVRNEAIDSAQSVEPSQTGRTSNKPWVRMEDRSPAAVGRPG